MYHEQHKAYRIETKRIRKKSTVEKMPDLVNWRDQLSLDPNGETLKILTVKHFKYNCCRSSKLGLFST